jgi:hypothetical protein
MQNTLIKFAILFALYKFVPNSAVKAAVLGVAGVAAAEYIPYVNGKDLKGAAV